MIKKRRQRNDRLAFTLLEVIIVLVLVCITVYSCRSLYRLYAVIAVRSATDQLVAVGTYLEQCALSKQVSTYFLIDSDRSYRVYDGTKELVYSLPAGVTWGGIPGLYGPPSSPRKLVTQPVVGGYKVGEESGLAWDATGAATPATCYIKNGSTCGACSVSRSIVGGVTGWMCVNHQWVRR